MDKVEVYLNDKLISKTLVKSFDIIADIDASTIKAELELLLINDNATVNYIELLDVYSVFKIKVNDVMLFMGYRSTHSTEKNISNFTTIRMSLDTKASDFYNSSIRGKRSFNKGQALFYVVQEMLIRNNWKVIEENTDYEDRNYNEISILFKVDEANVQETARLDETTKEYFQERLLQDTGLVQVKVPNTQIYQIDDDNFSFLSRISNQFNINMTSDAYGNIVLYKPNPNIKTPIKIDEKRIKNLRLGSDDKDRFNTYEVEMKTQFKDKKTNTRQKERSQSFDRSIRDTRYTIINSRDTLNGQGLQMKIDGFAGVQKSRSRTFEIELPFLSKTDIDKTFFEVGDVVVLDLKKTYLGAAFENYDVDIFLIKAIRYEYNTSNFAKKVLTLVENNYFNAESLKVSN